jgi:anti-anti-sigma factor
VTDLPLWNFLIREDGESRIVALGGELDLAAAEELQAVLIEQLDRPGVAAVVVELADVTFFDSAALGVLIRALQHAQENGRRFTVTRVADGARRVLQIAGVYELLSDTVAATDD